MFVGTLTITIIIHDCSSLKDKRHVLHGVVEKIRKRFNISAAEVGNMDLWQRATIGIAAVSNDRRVLNGLLDGVVDFLEKDDQFDVTEVVLELDR